MWHLIWVNYLFPKGITDRVRTSLKFGNRLEIKQYIMYMIILSGKIQGCYGYQNAECFEQIWGHIYNSQFSSRLTMFQSSFQNSTWYCPTYNNRTELYKWNMGFSPVCVWFVPFRFFVFSTGVMALRHDEITPREKTKKRKKTPSEITKRRNNARRNDEITKCATRNDEKRARKDEKTPCEIASF